MERGIAAFLPLPVCSLGLTGEPNSFPKGDFRAASCTEPVCILVLPFPQFPFSSENIIYYYENICRMRGSASETIYCIYCGFSEVAEILLHKDSSQSPRSLSAQVAGTGGGYTGTHGSRSSIVFPTHLCKKCKKTEAKGTLPPVNVWLTDNNGYHLDVLLPESLLRFFGSIRMEDKEISSSIQGVQRRLKQIFNKFERTGINPCKNGKHGYKAKLPVRGNKVDVYVLVENNGTGRYARIVYDGGRSFCE